MPNESNEILYEQMATISQEISVGTSQLLTINKIKSNQTKQFSDLETLGNELSLLVNKIVSTIQHSKQYIQIQGKYSASVLV